MISLCQCNFCSRCCDLYFCRTYYISSSNYQNFLKVGPSPFLILFISMIVFYTGINVTNHSIEIYMNQPRVECSCPTAARFSQLDSFIHICVWFMYSVNACKLSTQPHHLFAYSTQRTKHAIFVQVQHAFSYL